MTSKLRIYIAVAVIIFGVASAFYLRKSADLPKPVQPEQQSSFLPIPEVSSPASASVAIASAPISVASVPKLTLQQQVDKYRASGKPEDALLAHDIIAHCLYVRRDQSINADRVAMGGKPAETVDSACGDLAASTIAGSYQLVDQAAKAGVHGAAAAVMDAGVGGLGDSSTGDVDGPDFKAYEQRMRDAVAKGVETNDCFSLNTASGFSDMAKDYVAALDYLDRAAKECPTQGKKVNTLEQRRARLTALANQHR